MKVSDYIVEFLINHEVTDVFGYPGGMVTHLMDSLQRYSKRINVHVMGHEQGAAFSACGYAEATRKVGVAYATSGPGATNLLTGIANAYFDSLPCVFITGQVNTYESKGDLPLRQRGFQETNIIEIVDSITKYAVQVNDPEKIIGELEKAFFIAKNDRPGPVLIDIPMNVSRAEINPSMSTLRNKLINDEPDLNEKINQILFELNRAKKPVFIAGHGITLANATDQFRILIDKMGIPVVTSMIARDIIPSNHNCDFGFLGAYGNRYANIIVNKSDLIISFGSRLDCRQVGNEVNEFAKNAKVIRIDIDENEFSRKIKENELDLKCSVFDVISELNKQYSESNDKYKVWFKICSDIKKELQHKDELLPNKFVREISKYVPDHTIISTDVGQNQVWVAQSFLIKENQRIMFSGGHGAMGYSLPSAIGVAVTSKNPVISFNGDGGFQMNIQELQVVDRERLPIKIIVMNNRSLGMIRHFQEMYFDSVFTQTTLNNGYSEPNLKRIASAYNLKYLSISSLDEVSKFGEIFIDQEPYLIEVITGDSTYVYPKLAMGRPTSDQDPLLDREQYDRLLSKCDEE